MRHPFEMPLLFTASLVILIIQATAQQQQVLYHGADHRNAKFVKYASTKLDVGPFLREKVEDWMECTFSCLQQAQCLSFNMAVKAVENKYDCLLLSADKYSKSERLMSTRDFNHHSIAVSQKFHMCRCELKFGIAYLKPSQLLPCFPWHEVNDCASRSSAVLFFRENRAFFALEFSLKSIIYRFPPSPHLK